MYNLIKDDNTNMLYNQLVSIEKKLELITNFSAHGNKTRACKETGMNYVTFLYHMEHDDEFRKRIREAKEAQIDEVEEIALRAAKSEKGFKDRKMYLEAHRPDKYSPKVKHTVETTDTRLLGLLDKAKGYDKVLNALPIITPINDLTLTNNEIINLELENKKTQA